MRFFERVKIERQLHKLEKQAAGQALGAEQQAQLEQLKEDLQVRIKGCCCVVVVGELPGNVGLGGVQRTRLQGQGQGREWGRHA